MPQICSEKIKMNYMQDNPSSEHLRTQGKPELAGKLMRVQIVRTFHKNAIGFVPDGDRVFVNNGALTLDPDMGCLAKFDYIKGTTQGNFVCSFPPKGFKGRGLCPERYLLYGAWMNWMKKLDRFPDFNEINRYYDPGNLKRVIYLIESGAYAIEKDRSVSLSHLSYREIILGEFPDPEQAPKVVLAEPISGEKPMRNLEKFLETSRKLGIRPIKLEDLRSNFRTLVRNAKLMRKK